MNMLVLEHSNLHITSIHISFSLMRSVPRRFEPEATFSLGAVHSTRPSPFSLLPSFSGFESISHLQLEEHTFQRREEAEGYPLDVSC